jgi:hypothetical protein
MKTEASKPKFSRRWRRVRSLRNRSQNTIQFLDDMIGALSPISDGTRKSANVLLLVSAVGFVMDSASLIPADVTVVGIRFQGIDEGRIVTTMAIVIAFLCFNWLVRASADIVSWWNSGIENIQANELRSLRNAEYEKDLPTTASQEWEAERKQEIWVRLKRFLDKGLLIQFGSGAVRPATTAFEILFPYAFALYVIFALIRR